MNTRDRFSLPVQFLFLALSCLPLYAQAPGALGADAIVAEMDRRMAFGECAMVIRIDDVKADGKARSMSARVEYVRDVGTRIEFDEPARERGKRVLMRGSSMWMSSPAVSKPIRLSGKDTFMGTSFTNDDMMNLDKSDDYDAAILSSDDAGWTIVMTARSSGLPYAKIEARISRGFLPVSMTYYARSGRESKRVVFSEVRDFGGTLRPSVMTITDLMKPGDRSSVTFVDIRETAVDRSRLDPSSLES